MSVCFQIGDVVVAAIDVRHSLRRHHSHFAPLCLRVEVLFTNPSGRVCFLPQHEVLEILHDYFGVFGAHIKINIT
jgi:hypothetical protein